MTDTRTPDPILDSVRGLLIWYGGGVEKRASSLRHHISRFGGDVVVPSDFHDLHDEGHVNKSMFADILYLTFANAAGKL